MFQWDSATAWQQYVWDEYLMIVACFSEIVPQHDSSTFVMNN